MGRVEIDEATKKEIYAKAYHEEELTGKNNIYKYLLKDAESKNKKNLHYGYSVMLFGTQVGKVVNEGDLFEKFFKNFKDLENNHSINIGWELIYKNLFED